MYEATFRVSGHSTYADATAGTSARIELWCNRTRDLLHVRHGGTDRVLERVRETVDVGEYLENDEELVVITGDCLLDHESGLVEPFLDRHGCLLLYPLVYERGERLCRVLALSSETLTACYRDMVESGLSVTVKSKRDIDFVTGRSPLIAARDLLPELSDRQAEVLKLAYAEGYYDIPRETTTEELAETVGVERRTVEEHLRRAENKLLESVVDYLA